MAFLQETPQPFFRVPGIVLLLIAVLLGIELSREFLWAAATSIVYTSYGFVPALYSHAFLAGHHYNTPTLLARTIPFVSYMFLHGGFTHVAVNCIWLLAFGPVIARRYGSALFVLFFLVCGVAAAAVYLACAWGSDGAVVGASGAIAGLMGGAFRLLGSYPDFETAAPTPLFSRRILLWSAIWFAVNAIAGLTGLGAGPGPALQIIAWQAHIGGYVAGLLLVGPFDGLAKRLGCFGKQPAAS